MQETVKQLTAATRFCKVLGCYPSEEIKPTAVSAVQALNDIK
jgi:chorismate mutase/prephenate dehydratase